MDIFFIATILIIVFGSPLFYDSILDDGFRYSESSFSIKEDARSHIWSEAWDFIQSTPVGGIFIILTLTLKCLIIFSQRFHLWWYIRWFVPYHFVCRTNDNCIKNTNPKVICE